MGIEEDGGTAGSPPVHLVAGWPGGLHAAPRQQLGPGCCCCYGDQGEGCCCYCCSQAGWHHCHPALREDRSGDLCERERVVETNLLVQM